MHSYIVLITSFALQFLNQVSDWKNNDDVRLTCQGGFSSADCLTLHCIRVFLYQSLWVWFLQEQPSLSHLWAQTKSACLWCRCLGWRSCLFLAHSWEMIMLHMYSTVLEIHRVGHVLIYFPFYIFLKVLTILFFSYYFFSVWCCWETAISPLWEIKHSFFNKAACGMSGCQDARSSRWLPVKSHFYISRVRRRH